MSHVQISVFVFFCFFSSPYITNVLCHDVFIIFSHLNIEGGSGGIDPELAVSAAFSVLIYVRLFGV